MTSKNKMNKLKNSYCVPSTLKEKDLRLKRLLFFTPSLRRKLKQETLKELEQ